MRTGKTEEEERDRSGLAPLVGTRFALFAVPTVAMAAVMWPFMVDDAFVTFRYAENLLGGHGYAFNPGAVSDGVTAPLWLLCVSVLGLLGLPLSTAAKVLGTVCMAASAGLLASGLKMRAAILVSLFLFVQLSFPLWAVGGLETGLATLVLTMGVLALVRGRPGWLSLCLFLLPWVRPELLPAGVVLTAAFLLMGPRPPREVRSPTNRPGRSRVVLALVLGIASVAAFRLGCFSRVWPLAALAKPSDPLLGLEYVLLGVVMTTGVVGLYFMVLGARTTGKVAGLGPVQAKVLAVMLVVHLLGLVLSGGDWMPGYRLLVPVLPATAWLWCRGFEATWLRHRKWAVGLAAASLLVPVALTVSSVPSIRDSEMSRQGAGQRMRAALQVYERVALLDVGYFAFGSPFEVIDLGGITDASVASLKGGHLAKEIEVGWLADRNPDAILLHSETEPLVVEGELMELRAYPVEMRLARFPWVREHFRVEQVVRYAPDYYYVLLVRRVP